MKFLVDFRETMQFRDRVTTKDDILYIWQIRCSNYQDVVGHMLTKHTHTALQNLRLDPTKFPSHIYSKFLACKTSLFHTASQVSGLKKHSYPGDILLGTWGLSKNNNTERMGNCTWSL